MDSKLVNFSHQDNVGIITLNRPEALNALSPAMFSELGQAVLSCQSADVRAVILTGSGGSFCAGADVKDFVNELETGDPAGLKEHLRTLADTFHRVQDPLLAIHLFGLTQAFLATSWAVIRHVIAGGSVFALLFFAPHDTVANVQVESTVTRAINPSTAAHDPVPGPLVAHKVFPAAIDLRWALFRSFAGTPVLQ